MPLLDNLPVIDDRRHADLMAEARARIPRYTPEWTDLNDNDPGIAIVQLLAWMSEMLIFRLGQVPQLNQVKFLELLGIELQAARPAQAQVTLGVLPTFSEPTLIVPMHTQIAAEVPGADAPVVFETEQALIAVSAALDAVLLDSGFELIDASAANDDADTGFAPFGRSARSGASLLLGFTSALDFPSTQLDLMFWLMAPARSTPLVVAGGDDPVPPATLAWEYWNGAEWMALDLLSDQSAAFSRSGHVLLQTPAATPTTPAPGGPLQRTAMGSLADARYWIRARLVGGAYQVAPLLAAVRTNTVGAQQAQTVDAELLGRATGLDDQVFTLANRPVLEASLVLQVDEGPGFESWTEVDDFFASGVEDKHYVLDRSTGELRFGRGASSRVPMANPNRPSNVLALQYRFGGGASGNVGATRINALRGGVAGIDADAVGNLFAAGGGSDEEVLAAAQQRAAASLKSHERAVTAKDFELHARLAGAARAHTLPLHHPDFAELQVPGVVSVVVLPPASTADPLQDPAPMPTESTLRAICRELDRRRLLTTELYVIAPRYREIAISATLVCRSSVDLAAIKGQALLQLQRWFHPLIGGDDASLEADGSGWPFGGDIYHSALVQRLLLPGVRRVNDVVIRLAGQAQPECSDVSLPPTVLLKSGAHQLQVVYER